MLQEILSLCGKRNFYFCVRKNLPVNIIVNHVHAMCSANLLLFYAIALKILVKEHAIYGPLHT